MSSYRLNCSLGGLDSNGQSDKSKQNYFIIDETYSNEVICNERYKPCRAIMLLHPVFQIW